MRRAYEHDAAGLLGVMLGVLLGIAIGWLLAAARTRTELVKSQVDAEGRVKRGGRATGGPGADRRPPSRAGWREQELGGLQQKLRDEGEQKVKAQTGLENARIAAKIQTNCASA